MATSHKLEYSKSSKAPCHGLPPCKGTPIELGALRYGAVTFAEYGETVQWRHWGCVTPDILARLKSTKLERVPGFNALRPEDQAKIRMAVGLRRIDPRDVPESAKLKAGTATSIPSFSGATQKKRKATDEPVAGPSQSGGAARTRVIHIDEDIEEIVPVEEVKDELYVTLRTNVVGVQYYQGLVGPGEEVRLVREPSNRYDRNAIKVENIGHTQVGHIPRDNAARLAPLMDRQEITVEGIMHEGNMTGRRIFNLSMTLKIYGPADKRAQLEPRLIWATPGQRGFPPRIGGAPVQAGTSSQPQRHMIPPAMPSYASGPYGNGYPGSTYSSAPSSSQRAKPGMTAAQIAAQQETTRKQQEALVKAQELRQILNNLEKVDDEGRRTSLLDTLCSTEDVLALPLHPNPPGIQTGDLKINLLKHQSQALQWCLEREYPLLPKKVEDKPVQFWQLRKNGSKPYYYNVATKTPQTQAPSLGRGALCADSMGLGKTLTMLALILATKTDVPIDHSRATLIVVPLSVLSNWEKQMEDHVKDGAISHCVYYGSGRNMTPEQLKKYDVVLTTYQTVAKEHGDLGLNFAPSQKKQKTEKALFDVRWKRIILDEGHTIRNSKTKMAKAVCGLHAERRWVLTGTPIINSPADLGSILKFLQICRPLDNEDFYKRMVLRPLKDADPAGVDLMKALMNQICIRRTKEMQDSEGNHLVPLPPVDITVVKVTLTEEARELYDSIDTISKERVGRLIERHGSVNSAVVQSNVLSMLTRLRQLALHPGLVPPNYLEQLRAAADSESDEVSAPVTQLTQADKIRLQGLLAQAIEDNEECPICFDILNNPRITSCSHTFCLACITEVISRDPKCPMDRRPMGMGDLIEALPPTELTQAPVMREEDEDLVGIRAGSSAKIDQLIHLLKLTPGTEKSLVFSQFTSFMDKIAESLEAAGISYVRFDGAMSAKRRQETIARFSVPLENDESPAVIFTQAPSATQERSTRQRRKSTRTASQVIDLVSDDEQDGDFVANTEGDAEDDDDFIVEDEEDDRPKKKGKGKAKVKGKAKRKAAPKANYGTLDEGVNPKVMLISLKAGALGLNLTVANNVYLMDPWWQEGIESQAIDRCNRIGQTKPVHVYQLIAEDTVEAKVLDIQDKKKKLVEQAFSGIKRKETQREKKEARLQELVQLFGLRQASQDNSGGQRTLDKFSA